MPIPGYNSKGLIPPMELNNPTSYDRSPYLVTMSEVVEYFGTTPHRRTLIRNLIAYRRIIFDAGYTNGIQYLNGSFVENVEFTRNRPPGDIDVFSLLNVPNHYLTDDQRWRSEGYPVWENEIQNQPLNKTRFSLDTYAALFEDFEISDLLQQVLYWYSLFSHQKDTFAWKGFIAVTLDSNQDLQALELLGSE